MKKTVKIGDARYEIEDEGVLIFLVHTLASDGFTPSEIAHILGITRKEVIQYLEDCWG